MYEKYDAAETDEQKTEIAKQIQSLQGNASSDKYVAISGGERVVDPSTGATEKLPDVLLNTSTGDTKQQSKAERSFSDPAMVALKARDDIDIKEKERLANLYMDGGDI